MDRELVEVLILTAQHDLISSLLCNDYAEISKDLDTELGYLFDDLDSRRSEILTNMIKKIAPNAKA